MINGLNQLVEHIEDNLTSGADTGSGAATGIDVEASARAMGVTEYHVRRMFSSVAGMPLSEYIRRRRMTVAAGDVIRGDDFLTVAVRYGYGSAEAFGRAFRAVHGISPAQARSTGGPLRSQPHLRFRLTVEGSTSMDARIVHRPTLRLIGPSVRVPLIYEGVNPHIAEFTESLPEEIHGRLREIGTTHEEGPSGLLAISNEISQDVSEGTELTYMHGVAVADGESRGGDPAQDVPCDLVTDLGYSLDVIEVPEGDWAVFRSSGPFPESLQTMWAATATDWFPSNPWQLRPGPSLVSTLEHNEDFTTATCELWYPVEPR